MFSQREILFDNDKNIGLEGEIMNASTNICDNDDNIKHIIEYALSCTLEGDGEVMSSCVGLRFGTIHEVFDAGRLRLQ